MQNLSYMINMASKQLKNKLDKALKKHDITAAQFSVIIQIYISEHPITAAEIAQKIGSDRPTISGIINRLEKKNIVLKVSNPDDKRSSYLEIHKESKELVNKIITISDELTTDTFSIYSKEESIKLKEMILRLIERTE
ncbi:MarR family winged helix-turn-helix transcriptional regulator [Clostridium lacusfryxellense]|uniref:MarR family winged helix-turn-helix transcriptional regulator n=1 Tax=Clostridium lacusfryxellense TaxID=205328 RepID=UPI001C0E3506|nr:MarR family transcriptional regulator [Clostridium lacusfryxellense]MBU3112377.1 MarR family transcriptional regulator [Clostridium lacusfryxellense]